MKRYFSLILTAALLLPGCTAPLTLEQVKPKRIFALTKPVVFETVRFFSIKHEFRIQSFEEESGRIIGYRTYTPSGARENKMIIMHLRVTPAGEMHTEVDAKFAFTNVGDALTRDEEGMLVDAYTALFDELKAKAE